MTLLIPHNTAQFRLAIDPAPLLLALLLHRRCLFASLEAKVPISTTADLFSATAPSKLLVKSEEPLYILRRVRGDKTDLQLEVGNLNKQLTEDAVKAGVTQGNLTQYRNEHSDEETKRLQLRLRNLSGIPTLEHLPSSKDRGKSQIEQFWQQLQTNLGDLQTLPAGVESTWNAVGHLLGSRVAVESWGADHGLSLTEEADEVKRHWETLNMHTDGCPEVSSADMAKIVRLRLPAVTDCRLGCRKRMSSQPLLQKTPKRESRSKVSKLKSFALSSSMTRRSASIKRALRKSRPSGRLQ